jgi:DNA polymerase
MQNRESDNNAQRNFIDALNSVAAHLQRLKEEGVQSVEADPETVRRLGIVSAPVPVGKPPVSVPTSKNAPASDVAVGLEEIARQVGVCVKCPLHKGRTRTVPGQGCAAPEIMFVGEGPGYEEDQQGLAFVGRAGQLLTKIIEAMGLTRDQVFIGNIVKCRPPENRKPLPDEMRACLPYLRRQIQLLNPKIIVALGATAVQGLLEIETAGITRMRGKWLNYNGIDLMPTYHPAYLLRNPTVKKDVWEDMKAVLAKLGRQPPSRMSERPTTRTRPQPLPG